VLPKLNPPPTQIPPAPPPSLDRTIEGPIGAREKNEIRAQYCMCLAHFNMKIHYFSCLRILGLLIIFSLHNCQKLN
jgi:hypothetical protein